MQSRTECHWLVKSLPIADRRNDNRPLGWKLSTNGVMLICQNEQVKAVMMLDMGMRDALQFGPCTEVENNGPICPLIACQVGSRCVQLAGDQD